jgi:hypothetical protein
VLAIFAGLVLLAAFEPKHPVKIQTREQGPKPGLKKAEELKARELSSISAADDNLIEKIMKAAQEIRREEIGGDDTFSGLGSGNQWNAKHVYADVTYQTHVGDYIQCGQIDHATYWGTFGIEKGKVVHAFVVFEPAGYTDTEAFKHWKQYQANRKAICGRD